MAKLLNRVWKLGILLMLVHSYQGYSQLQFCGGNSGEAIFTETFGTGTVPGPPLPPGTTSYRFTTGTPNDGDYTIWNIANFFDWHIVADRTPNDTDGKYLIVNADFVAGEFYQRTISGLCENTSYEFSSWLINLLPSTTACPNGGIPINVSFQIWDSTDTQLLASGSTGPIPGTFNPIWEQYGLVFQTEPGQTSVILKMINNGIGGCGNDLGIDDIVFKTCGDFVEITEPSNQTELILCEDQGATSFTLTATPDFTVFNSHFYQWQESTDQVNWVDIPGADTASYTTPFRNTTHYYRVKVAEDPLNTSNALCNIISNVFQILYIPIPAPPPAIGPVEICTNEDGAISLGVANNTSINWYDSPTGGNLLLENNTTFIPEVSGTYYAETTSTLTDCISPTRTAIEVTFYDPPNLEDEALILCEGSTLLLSAQFPGATYLWSNGATTETISIQEPGTYSVDVSNAQLCTSTKTILVTQIDSPVIASVESDQNTIVVTLANTGNYEYSLDGTFYSDQNSFDSVLGGLYTIYVRNSRECPPITTDYLHIVVPNFFSPNGDGINESFKPQGVEFSGQFKISIFNRLGNLLVSSNNTDFSWDGRFNGRELPAADYWYRMEIDNQVRTGHFSLIR